jgi:ornithine cyclodeaminase/alanine dehydrogenase-like protein (mu-crystallin family)
MDGTYITAIRTGGAAAVAARALAREDAKVLAILGAGAQGGSHLETFPRVRDFVEIRVASRDAGKAAALAARQASSWADGARGRARPQITAVARSDRAEHAAPPDSRRRRPPAGIWTTWRNPLSGQ